MSEIVWRGMTRAELDKAYDNTNAVADSGARREGCHVLRVGIDDRLRRL